MNQRSNEPTQFEYIDDLHFYNFSFVGDYSFLKMKIVTKSVNWLDLSDDRIDAKRMN